MAWRRQKAGAKGNNEITMYPESARYYFVKADEELAAKPGWSRDAAVTYKTHRRRETHIHHNRPLPGIIDMPDDMWGKRISWQSGRKTARATASTAPSNNLLWPSPCGTNHAAKTVRERA